tara:strand:- start:1573 stop:1779 length:207 start_codon:yes stop_codon:yes gene_type:complete
MATTATLLVVIILMGLRIKELKQYSINTSLDCIENSKTMTEEEIEHCLPVMEMLGFKLKPINNNNQTK